uniref:BRCC36 C-terminal helical domain-containing protein n=1 Tax=Chenopodium quinoa TaxID=63459 RepID=A0A803LEF4_CHEQI
MSLTNVKMSEEVWLTCVTHAFSTETEEIMGLLLGDIECSRGGNTTALIWGAAPQTRSDRRKDRVETNPEQLAAASAMAEISFVLVQLISVNSFTLCGAAMYQLLDSGFIGLIFSCFNEDAFKVGRIQAIAFQSLDGKQSYNSRPITISPVQKNNIIDVESSLSSDDASRLGSGKGEKPEQDTGDSRTAATKGSDRIGGKFHPDSAGNAFGDIDPMDMSDGMQEAMHRSHLEMSGAEYIRKEIPLDVLPASSLLKLDSPLASFTDLQRVLYEEEKAAYNQAISQNIRDGKLHPLTFIHHTSTYQASMCKLMEYCLTPAIEALEDHLRENELRLGMLTEEAKVLEAEASRGTEGTVGSPLRVDGYRGSPARAHSFGESMNARSPAPASPSSRSRKGF